MKTRTPKEELRFDIEAATGGKGVYTWELVEEIMQAIERYEQQVKSVDLADVVGQSEQLVCCENCTHFDKLEKTCSETCVNWSAHNKAN